MAGIFSILLHVSFLAGPEERKTSSQESQQQQGLSCAIQPVDFRQRSRGFNLRWFQRSCIEGCKSKLVIAGGLSHPFALALLEGPEERRKGFRESRPGLSGASQPLDFRQRSQGFNLYWFQRSCLDTEGCKLWLVIAGGLSHPFAHASLAGPEERKRSSRESKQQQGLPCAIQPVDFSQRSQGFILCWF